MKKLLTGFQSDLLFMWRARLNCDVQIVLHQEDPPVYTFWSHRFLLASRSPYFNSVLSNCSILEKEHPASNEVLALELPTPTFTPPGFFFTLGYIYTGTLDFTTNKFDLSTAFSIFKGSQYLNMPTLTSEIRARLVVEMMHGLFQAFLTDGEYEQRVGKKWIDIASTGCKCRQCTQKIPRVLKFALEEDISDEAILRGVRRAIVALFGEGWCTPEFAALSKSNQEYAVEDVKQLITTVNVFPLLFKAEQAFAELEATNNAGIALQITDIVVDVRKEIDAMFLANPDPCWESEAWLQIRKDYDSENAIRRGRAGRELEYVLKAVSRCVDINQARGLHCVSTFVLSLT